MRARSLRLGQFDDPLDDVLVAGATADVPDESVLDLFGCQRLLGVQEVERRHHDAGGTEAALKPVLAAQRVLDRVQTVGAVAPYAFDRRYFAAVDLNGE